MVETRIDLSKVADVNLFVNLASKCQNDVTLYSGKYIVDGKSLMGVFSLDLSKPIKMEIEGEIPDEVKEGMKQFIAQ